MGGRARLLLVPLVLLVTLASMALAAVAAADSGPSYFSGDGTGDAYGGSGMTWDGTPGYATGRTGAKGDRAFVIGENGVLTANDPQLGNFGTADFTLHLYVRLSPGNDTRAQLLSKRGDCVGGSFLDLRAGTSFGGVYFEIQDLSNFGFNVLNPANLFDNAWHEITATRAGTQVSLTVDGVRTTGTTNGVVNIDNGTPLRFGDGGCAGLPGDGTTRASGRLDEISFGPGTAVIGPPARAKPRPPAPATTTATPTAAPTAAPTVDPAVVPSTPPPTTTTDPSAPASTADPPAAFAPIVQPDPPAAAQPADPPQPRPQAGIEFMKSVPSPGEVFDDLAYIAQNALLAILLLALLALPIGVVNDTAKENAHRFAAIAARARRLRQAVVVVWTQRLRFTLGLVAAALLGAVIYGFVEPAFGFDLSSLALVLGMATAFLVVSAAKELSAFLYLGRAYDIHAFLRLFPAFALVALVCVTVSRAVGLEPGLILGTLAALGTRGQVSVGQAGRATAVSSGALAVICVIAWVVRTPVVEAADGFGAQFLGVALTAVAVAAAENLAFGLIPMSFLDGSTLFRWSKPVWAGFALFGAFAFVHVLLHRDAGDFAERAGYLAILLAIYFAAAFAFWAYFRFTRRTVRA